MRTFLTIIFIVFFSKNGFSQNLVLNGGFDDVNICSEYDAPCSPEAWRQISTLSPAIYGNHKNHYSELTIFNSSVKNVRGYLQSKLGDKLQIGKKYKISIQIKPSGLLINSIGVLLSDTLIIDHSGFLLIKKPQIEFTSDKFLKPTKKENDWLTLDYDFTAKSEANYIIVGCFLSDKDLKYKYLKNSFKEYTNYSYYIDNIRLIPLNTHHDTLKINRAKENIYSQDSRHPVPDRLFASNNKKKIIYDNSNNLLVIDTILLYDDLLFEFDSFKPTKSLIESVDSIFSNQYKSIEMIKVVGHTDNIGTNSYNENLSYKRAEAVSKYISSLYIVDEKKIFYLGEGSKKPIDTNLTKFGRHKNRRVEIIIKYRIIR